ncbi:lactococcin 972 family bacteriocin [Streptomyces chrestomyceticus]|uniref:lactococcin 972 family bacteriocin n=1 Tax=Streptomyces chrestomyceticus TaxID=68185 RepID=UPI0033D2DA74
MKFVRASISVAVTAAVLAAGAVIPASASDSQVHVYTASGSDTPPSELIGPNGEEPSEWGYASFPADGPSIKSLKTEKVGGGTWKYGPSFPSQYVKRCHSQYYHPSKKHSATAKIDGKSAKVTKGKGIWAKASKDGVAGTCYAYWGKYDK